MKLETPCQDDSVSDSVRLINAQQLRQLIPISKMTIWRWEKAGKLPAHITIGGRAFWYYAEVVEAIKQLTNPN